MRVKWTRDEVILALDVLFSTPSKSLSVDSPAIIELSELLNRLPIVSKEKRSDTFRNVAGVSRQLSTLQWGIKNNKEAPIGSIFYEVYYEFNQNRDRLHNIALAIRRCVEWVQNIFFADETEVDGFCEGALLAHLHRYLEMIHGNKRLNDAEKCCICGIIPKHIYNTPHTVGFFQSHLLILPEHYGPDIRLGKNDFIIVCPNCHCVLHKNRPWKSTENVRTILKTYSEEF